MRVLRMLEIALAVAAGGLAAFEFGKVLTSNFYCGQTGNGPEICYRVYDMSNPNIAEQNRVVLTYLVLLFVVLVVAISSAILYSRTRQNPWRLVLWGTAVFSVLFSVLSAASLGLIVMPASLVLLVAAIVSLGIPAAPAPLASQ